MSWFSGTHTFLAEAARQNTLQSIKDRAVSVEQYAKSLYDVVCKDIIEHSKKNVSPEIEFNITDGEFCKRVSGLSSLTFLERDHVLSCVEKRLKTERMTTHSDGTILKVSWSIETPSK